MVVMAIRRASQNTAHHQNVGRKFPETMMNYRVDADED